MKTKMKIAIFTENFIGFKGHDLFSGAELVLFELCNALIGRGHEVTVYQAGRENRIITYKGINVVQVKIPNFPFLNKLGITMRFHIIGMFFRKYSNVGIYDRIHLHYLFSAFPFVRTISTGMSHGIEWDDPDQVQITLRGVRDRFSFSLMKKIAKFNIKRMKAVVANDYNFLKYVESNWPMFRNKITYIPNYVDTGVFRPYSPEHNDLRAQDSNKFLILIPKFITKERGQELFIKALGLLDKEHLEKITLLLLGHIDPNSSYHVYLKNLIDQLGLGDTVVFLGHRDHFTELPELINSVDLVAIPSYCREGTSLSALEGLACKKPVLCTNIGALPELVYHAYSGFLAKPTPEDLSEKIIQIMNLPKEEIEQIAQRGYEFCTHNFNKQRWSKNWVEFFET